MDVALVLLLLLAAIIVGWYDTYSVQRAYADRCAERHGHIPPLIDWFFEPDPDAEVERWRRRHRNMYLLTSALVVAAVIVALVRAPTWAQPPEAAPSPIGQATLVPWSGAAELPLPCVQHIGAVGVPDLEPYRRRG